MYVFLIYNLSLMKILYVYKHEINITTDICLCVNLKQSNTYNSTVTDTCST